MGFEIDASSREQQPIRVLIARPGVVQPESSIKALVYALRKAGMTVFFPETHQTPETVVTLATKEDVDLVYLVSSPGAHHKIFAEVLRLMQVRGIDDVPLLGNGAISEKDVSILKELGVREIVGSKATPKDIMDLIRRLAT